MNLEPPRSILSKDTVTVSGLEQRNLLKRNVALVWLWANDVSIEFEFSACREELFCFFFFWGPYSDFGW